VLLFGRKSRRASTPRNIHEPRASRDLHLARLLACIVEDLPLEKIDRYLIGDAECLIEAIEALARIHTAQEQDIYDAVVAR